MTAADGLEAVLERSRSLGFLGPGSLRVQVEHAVGFAAGHGPAPGRFLDLGSGGGVPGLVLAGLWPDAEAVLLDAGERRCAFLAEAVDELGLAGRVRVVRARAENAGRWSDLRGTMDVVTARGFGPPPVTAECGAPFLRVGGRLVVSEPPDGDEPEPPPSRWPAEGLARVGLASDQAWSEPYRYRSFVAVAACPDRYPRRVGAPGKRPLF